MRKRFPFLLIIAVIGVVISCNKEVSNEHGANGNNPAPSDTTKPADTSQSNTEVATWKFISLHGTIAQVAQSSQASIPVKAVTNSDYTTEQNAGTVQFDGSKMIANGVTFTINTTAKTYFYLNGMPYDSVVNPLNTTIPPQNSSSDYKKIGADSLYFPSGGLLSLGTGGVLPAMPTGAKLKFNGNTMTMTVVYDDKIDTTYQGVPANITSHAVLVATLQKQ